MMNLHKLILTNNRCYKAGKTITPKGIMVHSTGADNPWLKRYVGPDDGLLGNNQYGNHWNNSNVDVCVHAFIGKLADGSIGTYQTLPWNYRGWHAGGSANNTHISFEICEDGLTDAAYFAKIYQEAVELCTYLCKLYGLTEKNIICHSEGYELGIASGHSDVMHWFPRHGKSMDTFRAAVKAQLNKGASTAPTQTEADTNATSQLYRVRKSWDDAKSQIGAYKTLANAKAACPDGYSVFDGNGKAVYSPTTATPSAVAATSTWKNGSTSEPVYADTAKKTKIGSLDAGESCDCLGTVGGMYIVKYKVNGTDTYKVGLVSYSGGL